MSSFSTKTREVTWEDALNAAGRTSHVLLRRRSVSKSHSLFTVDTGWVMGESGVVAGAGPRFRHVLDG